VSLRKVKPIDIPEDFRISITKELIDKVENKYLPPRGQYLYEATKVFADEQLEKLNITALNLVQKRVIDKNWDSLTITGLVLFMLLSRPK